MGFVHDNQVPVGIAQLVLVVRVTRELIQPADQLICFFKIISRCALFLLFTAKDFKLQAKFFQQFVLPLLGQTARGNNQNTLGIGPEQKLTDQQASHDSFACARIISQHIAQRLAR